MKTKAPIVLKSLAELPVNVVMAATSSPGDAASASKEIVTTHVRVTRRELRAVRGRSAEFVRDIQTRAHTRFNDITPWPRGGINE